MITFTRCNFTRCVSLLLLACKSASEKFSERFMGKHCKQGRNVLNDHFTAGIHSTHVVDGIVSSVKVFSAER